MILWHSCGVSNTIQSVKSMQTLHFSFFFFSITGLASRSGYCTSLINPIFRSLSTSSLTALARLGHHFHCFCFTSLNVGSRLDCVRYSWYLSLACLMPNMRTSGYFVSRRTWGCLLLLEGYQCLQISWGAIV